MKWPNHLDPPKRLSTSGLTFVSASLTFNRMVESSTDLDRIFGALADPTRRALIASLAEGSRSVGELARPFDLTLAGVSKHIKVLSRAGLVRQIRNGRRVDCSLRPEPLESVADWASRTRAFWASRLEALESVVVETKRSRAATGRGAGEADA